MLDPASLRSDFPVLSLTFRGKRIAYLDNAATTQKPRSVIEAVKRFYESSYANVGRGVYQLSLEATRRYEEARRVVAGFIGARPGELVFTRNATEGINMAAYSLLASGLLGRGKNIVISVMEHHSNMLPWARVAEISGAELRVAGVDDEGRLLMDELERLVDDSTTIVALTHVSNVTGVVNPVEEICRVAHEHGALCLVDGAQSVPHMPVDVKRIDADFLAFSGHKMVGPMGIGGLYIRGEVMERLVPPFTGGGTVRGAKISEKVEPLWVDMPYRFEAGTPNVAGAVGLAEAARYLERVGMGEVERHERRLVEELLEGLEGLNVAVYGPRSPEERSGIVTFNLRGVAPHDLAAVLDNEAIAVRSGNFCAAPLMERLGAPEGAVRASVYLYNDSEEVERLIGVLKKMEGLMSF